MRYSIWGKIMMYLLIWLALFVLLCVISIVKNWDILASAIMSRITAMIVLVVLIGAVFVGLVQIVTGGRR